MTEATANHDSLVRPEYEQTAELVAALKQQQSSLKLLADFPAKSDDMNKVFEWLERYSAFYEDDEGLRDAVMEVQKLDAAQRATGADTITKEVRQCQPIAERLYHTVDEIITLYDAVVAAYSRPLDVAVVRSEATVLLEGVAQRAYDKESERLYRSLLRIFPPRIAEVNAPEGCAVNVPTVNRWQRKHSITNRAVADQEYMRLTAKAREGVEQDLAETSRVVFTVTAEVSDDLRATLPLSVYDELHRCVTRMEDAYDNSQAMDDQLRQQLMIAQRCATALQPHAELSLDALHEQYVREVVGMQLDGAATTARQVATQQFMDVLAERLEMLKMELDMYTVTPGLAASGLCKAAAKKKRRKGGASVVNEVRIQEVREITLQPGDELIVDNEQFPWLDDEDIIRSVMMVERGAVGNVAVLDMRTPDTLEIEHKMTGYETKEKRRRLLPIIATKLQLIARAMAGGDSRLDSLSHIEHRSTNSYPLPIAYWKNITSNAVRIYVALVNVANMLDGEMKQQLMANNVDELLLYLGACDKHRQLKLLEQFTSHSRRRLSQNGAGSI